MVIRDIAATDLPALAGLLEALSGHRTDPAAMRRAFMAMVADASHHLLGAYCDGELAGTVMGVVCKDLVGACRPFLVAENMIVAARFRRRGLGRALLAELERRARALDCAYMLLVSGPDRTEAQAFYAAQGFAGAAGTGFKKHLLGVAGD